MTKFTHLENVDISSLLLDTSNPRLGLLSSQQDCIYEMFSDENDANKLMELIKSIATHGIMDQRIVVVKSEDENFYTVKDGNRRITALKVLNNPAEAPEKLRLKLKTIIEQAQTPITETVNCELAADLETAHLDMELKHTGEQKGAGQISWGAREKDNFALMTGKTPKYALSKQICEFLKAQGIVDTDKADITTLERIFTKSTLEKLGILVTDSKINFTNITPSTINILSLIVEDFSTKKRKVGDVYNKEERDKYIDEVLQRDSTGEQPTKVAIPPQADAPLQQNDTPTGAPSIGLQAPPKQSPPQYRGPTTATWDRKRLIPRYTSLHIPKREAKAYNVFVELSSKIDVREAPIAASVMFRLLIEFSVSYYIKKNNIQSPKHLHSLIDNAAKHMVSQNVLKNDDIKNLLSGCAAPIIKTQDLNAFVHDSNFQPTPQNINTAFENMQHFLALCWK